MRLSKLNEASCLFNPLRSHAADNRDEIIFTAPPRMFLSGPMRERGFRADSQGSGTDALVRPLKRLSMSIQDNPVYATDSYLRNSFITLSMVPKSASVLNDANVGKIIGRSPRP